jgi:hypothetical protein
MPQKELGALHFFGWVFLSLAAFFGLLSCFGVSILDALKFLSGLAVIVYVPGTVLCHLLRIESPRFPFVILSLSTGMLTSTVMYKLSRVLGTDAVFAAWLGLAAILFAVMLLRRPPRRSDFRFRITPIGIGFALIVALVTGMLLIDNFRNGQTREDGSLVINLHYYDGFIRNAVVRELSHSVPPQMPFASGFSLSYHYGMDLFLSLFHRGLGLSVPDLIHRFSISFFFFLFLGGAFILIRELAGSDRTAVLGTFLLVFTSGGLAYWAGLLLGVPNWGNVFYAFYLFHFLGINSILPAAAVLFIGMYAVSRACTTGRTGWAVLAALQLALVLEFKLFLIGPILASLLLAGAITWIFQRQRQLLKVLGITFILASPLILLAYLGHRNGLDYTLRIGFSDWIRFSFQDLRLTGLQKAWGDLVHRGLARPDTILAVMGGGLFFFVGSFGLNGLALPSMVKQFFSFRSCSPLRSFLISLFGGSVLYYFSINFFLGGRARNVTNIYVYFIGLMILTCFWAERIFELSRAWRRTGQAIFLIGVIGLGLPNTLRFLWTKYQTPQPTYYSAAFLEAAGWIERHSEPEATILHPLTLLHVCYVKNRRVVLDYSANSFLTYHLSAKQIQSRRQDVVRFFQDPRLNGDVLDTYGVAYILIRSPKWMHALLAERPRKMTCYRDMGTVVVRKFRKSHELTRVFSNPEIQVYAVRPIASERRSVYVMEEVAGRRVFKPFIPSIRSDRMRVPTAD